ncbi:MAG: hypothetical protein H6563_03195 [Lewinellaceae bacterium]|nr:hypothetical protein [Lewinellaceae bacterium]
MTLQSIQDHILAQIGAASIGTLPLNDDSFQVTGANALVESMKGPSIQLEIKREEIAITNDAGGKEHLLIPVQNATLEFSPGGVPAGLTLHSHDFAVRIYPDSGQQSGFYLEWEGAFDQFELTQFYNLGWLPDSIELPQLEFAELLLQGTTYANGEPATFSLGARMKESYEIVPDLDARLHEASVLYTGYVDPAKSSELTLSGLFKVGESGSRVTVTLPTAVKGPWTFSLDQSGSEDTFTLADLFQLVAGVNIFQELPAELNIADNFSLQELTLTYDFAQKTLSYIKVALSLGDWNLFYGLSILDAGLTIEITDPTLSSRTVQTTIGGKYAIKNKSAETVATLDVELFIPTDGSDWELNATGGLGDEDNGFLDAITGDLKVTEWLPDSISDPTIHINEFYLRFSPQRGKIFQTRIDVGLDLTLEIVKDVLSLGDPYFAFDIIWPDNPESDAIRVLELYGQTEKALIVNSLGDLSLELDELGKTMGEAQKLINTAKPGELANLQAEYRMIFLQKVDGIRQRFGVDVKNKLDALEKLEKVQAVIDDPKKALLDSLLNKLGLGLNPVPSPPVKTFETALENCKKSLRGSLFDQASNHAATAKGAADGMIASIGTETLNALLENLKKDSKNKPENKTKINAQLGGYVGLPGNTRMQVLATRDETKTWRFRGMLEGELKLIDTAKRFLGNNLVPPPEFKTDLTINVLEAEIVLPPRPAGAQAKADPTFRFVCGIKDPWSFYLGDFHLDVKSLLFAIEHRGPGSTAGALSGAAVFNGMNVELSYAFAPNQTKLALNWEGIVGEYEKTDAADQILRLSIQHKSVGDIISLLVRTAKPSLGTYRLPEPWNFLDKIPADLELEYWVKGPHAGQLMLTKALDIDLVVVHITGISVTRTASEEVFIDLHDLSHPKWDAANPKSAPPEAGGLAKRLIDLRLLALGQHVAVQNAGQIRDMKQAIDTLRRFTVPGADGIPNAILFDAKSHWLVGMDFGLLQVPPYEKPANQTTPWKPVYALQLSALFNDPNIYGLRIELNGDKIPPLKGLKFEILYTKINDSIGKYHVELVLPDIMRYIEAGAVSLVLPVIVVDVFTNGDFFIDFGFPYNLDFRRSFSITVIVLGVPVLGSGGFYFGKLSEATTPRPVPVSFHNELKPDNGKFNPIMIFGLGLQIGVGKYFQKGPLTARFSLTFVGMVEGIVATFNPNSNLPAGGKDINKTNYIYIQGTLGIVGILEGAVDFKIIKAKVLIRLSVIAQATYESYCVMPIKLSASVEVEVSIEVLFVTIDFSFSATISATFEVGNDTHKEAPWFKDLAQGRAALFARDLIEPAPRLDLTPLPVPAAKEKLTLFATLQPTIAWDQAKKPSPQVVFALLMECPAAAGTATGATPFEKMADSIYRWVVQGVLSTDSSPTMTRADLADLLEELRGDTLDILPYDSLKKHLSEQFALEVKYPAGNETAITGTPFPVFPFMKVVADQEVIEMTKKIVNGKEVTVPVTTHKITTVGFSEFAKCNPQYLNFLSAYFEATATQPEDPAFEEHPGFDPSGAQLSLVEQLFEDYFLTIAREMVGATIQWLEEEKQSQTTLEAARAALKTRNTAGHLSSMLARFYLGGQRMPKNAGLMLLAEPPTFDDRFGIFQATGQQIALSGHGKLTLTLTSIETLTGGWSLPATSYILPASLVQQLVSLEADAAKPLPFATKTLLTPFQPQARAYPLTRAIDWESGNRYIWEFTESIQRQLGRDAAAVAGMKIQVGVPANDQLTIGPAGNQGWGTLVEFNLKRTSNPLSYELIGTNEAGIALLEKIILTTPSPAWVDFQLLYRPVSGGLTQKKLSAPANADYVAFLTQINLSTETNPIQQRGMLAVLSEADRTLAGVLDQQDFLERLWTASIVRSGGHYLFYQDLTSGQGLPGDLFGQDDTATLYLLVNFGAVAPKNYMNCGLTDKNINLQKDLVFARDEHFTDKINELQPGQVLLEATRTKPAGAKANSFADLFQLLSYEVKAGTAFGNTFPLGGETEIISSTPIGPRKNGGANSWLYEQIVPAFKFADKSSLLFAFPPPTDISDPNTNFILPASSENPYAGVGKKLEVQLQIRDVYGNAIPNPADTAGSDLKYVDALIPVHQWPATSLGLVFKENALEVTLTQSEKVYNSLESDQDRTNAYQRDLRLFKKIYYQLFQQDDANTPHIRVDLRSTFLGDELSAAPAGSPNAGALTQLRTFVAQAINYLERKLRTVADSRPAGATLSRSITPATINPATIFELLVEIQLRRTNYIHPDLQSEEAVFLGRTPVKPFSAENEKGTDNWEIALGNFATQLETLFPTLKLATGFDKGELDNYDQQKDLFLVRMNRFAWSKNEPVALALPPLATQLQEHTANVRTYSKEEGLNTAATNQQEFTRIDMDDWARTFLEAFDTVLSPDLAGAIYLLDELYEGKTGYLSEPVLKHVLDSKKKLAGAIAGKLKPILEADTIADKSQAVEKLKQRLLMELAQAYEVNAVVHYPVTLANPETGIETRLYGSPVIVANDGTVSKPSYTLSNAKIEADKANSHLDFLFTTKSPTQEPFVSLDLAFKISHLEYGIQSDPRFEGYQASSWLSFVHPPAPVSLGKVNIPIVLRDFPEAPVLLQQAAVQSDDFVEGMTAAQILDIAVSWDYQIKYNQRLTSQDWLQVEVQFNLSEAEIAALRGFSENLLDALAIFTYHWPRLRSDLLTLLPGINAKTIQTLPDAQLQQAANAVMAFANLARNVADTWEAWTPPVSELVGPQDAVHNKLFAAREFGVGDKLTTEFKDLNPAVDPNVPDPVILVGPDETGPSSRGNMRHEYNLDYKTANAEPLRALTFEKLHLLAYQNAISAVYLSRNEELIPGKKSAPDFVYYTPQTRFPAPIIPLLNNDIEVNIGQLIAGKNPLVNYLSKFFQELFKDVYMEETGEKIITMQLDCSYAYKLADDPAQPFIRLPIILVPPYEFHLDGPQNDTSLTEPSLSAQIAREIKEWQAAENPAPDNALARLVFDVAAFSTTSKSSRQPILRLRNVVLPLEELK